jgi:hypothetical protein
MVPAFPGNKHHLLVKKGSNHYQARILEGTTSVICFAHNEEPRDTVPHDEQ